MTKEDEDVLEFGVLLCVVLLLLIGYVAC